MPMLAQVAHGDLAAQLVQRMVRIRHGDEVHGHQRLAAEPGRHTRCDAEIRRATLQRLCGAAEHRFEPLDARLRALCTEAIQADEHHPGWKQHFDGQADLCLPACRDLASGALELAGIVEQCPRASVEHLTDASEHCFAPLDLERAHLEHPLQLLHGIGD